MTNSLMSQQRFESDAVTTEYRTAQAAPWREKMEAWKRSLVESKLKRKQVAVEIAEITRYLKRVRRWLDVDRRTVNSTVGEGTRLQEKNNNYWTGLFSNTADVQCGDDRFDDTARAFVGSGMRPLFRSTEKVYVSLLTNKKDFADRHARVMASWGRHVKHMSTFTGPSIGPHTENVGIPMEYDTIKILPKSLDNYNTLHKKTLIGFKHACASIERYRFFFKVCVCGFALA
eukprot:TRINITY_DN27752_c0_g1_i2.p1 TRINITY_DN27752_c0_g1~~TRINITY_DN27752_c0_g1_i2.p1  ORF type:complete len:230 (-),score=20.66 TRINITY_DN27752_c0_g1_i2:710-1399(-)